LSRSAGHDINYIALSGALAMMGPADRPPLPPANLVGDFGGGGLFAAFGILAGVIEAGRTGQGRVIDAAMLDGAVSQMGFLYSWAASGAWRPEREANLLDGAAPFYRCYTCACGGHVAVGAIEPAFFAAMMQGLELDPGAWDQTDRADWPRLAETLAKAFAGQSRDHWAAHFAGTDACVTPVLTMWEAADHPHNRARGTLRGDPPQPAPGPRFGAGLAPRSDRQSG
ncbi:MAG: CoA transferase, partial [Pseudomonadota bacterium]